MRERPCDPQSLANSDCFCNAPLQKFGAIVFLELDMASIMPCVIVDALRLRAIKVLDLFFFRRYV